MLGWKIPQLPPKFRNYPFFLKAEFSKKNNLKNRSNKSPVCIDSSQRVPLGIKIIYQNGW